MIIRKLTPLTIAAALLLPISVTAGRVIDIDTPSLKVYLPDKELNTGRFVVVCPGGGYGALATGREGHDWAPYFNKLGIGIGVLSYTLPRHDCRIPQNEAFAALKLVRDSATVWDVNPRDVGIMGSSAGGHLAATVSTLGGPLERPDFQILLYPVISMQDDITNIITRRNLMGDNPSQELKDVFSGEIAASWETPRAFIALSDDDRTVDPLNSTRYYEALKKAGVPATLHIYPSGDHGWGILERFRYKNEMLTALESWLASFEPRPDDTPGLKRVGQQPTLFIIGDSTVKNEDRDDNTKWGWGTLIETMLDTSRIAVENHARPGRSARSYREEGLWDRVIKAVRPGDFVMIQFGHNDSSPLNTGRCRGDLPGIGDESEPIVVIKNGRAVDVKTYGHYLRQYIREVRAAGATPILVTPPPRNRRDGDKIAGTATTYSLWMHQVASDEGVDIIDLDALDRQSMETLGQDEIATLYKDDNTHFSLKGARLNVANVVKGLNSTKSKLKKYLKK